MASQVDGPEPDGVPRSGRLRAGMRNAGTALRASLYGDEAPLRWGAAPDSGWRRYVVRLTPVLAALLALFAAGESP